MSARIDTFRQQKPGATGRDATRGSAKQRKPVAAHSAVREEESAGVSGSFRSSQMCRRSFGAITPSAMLLACDAASETPITTDPPAHADDAQAEAQLRAFDLDSKFGGCIGLTRLERCALEPQPVWCAMLRGSRPNEVAEVAACPRLHTPSRKTHALAAEKACQ